MITGSQGQSVEALARRQRDAIYPIVSKMLMYGDHPLAVERAKGLRLWDVEGREYLDFFGGILTVSVGHCNDEVTEATIEQLRRVQHTSSLYLNEITIRVAEKIAQITPGRLSSSFFTSSGSEANETAIMTARMYTGRTDVITLRHAYSGRTQTAMSLTAHASWRSGHVYDGYIKHVRSPYAYRAPLGLDEDALLDLCVQDLEETLATVTDGKIAAFMAEPIQGVGGFIVLPRDYFKRILPIVREAGGLLIVDEVQTGWGRTGGHMCAIEHWGVEPDIMVFAKGIANGSPVGVTVTTPEIAASVDRLTIATFGGNPVSMAAALATIEYIERHELVKNAATQGARLRAHLEALQARHPFIGDVRGMGLMQGLEIVVPDGSRAPDAGKAAAFVNAAREHGLLLGKGGLYGNAIRVAPPLTVGAPEVEEAAERMGRALAEVA